MRDDEHDTMPCPPPDFEEDRSFEKRLMALSKDSGARRLNTWQENHLRSRRFNARGCL